MNQIASRWEDYECIDAGNGEKLERWKDVILRRPDPLALWPIDRRKAASGCSPMPAITVPPKAADTGNT